MKKIIRSRIFLIVILCIISCGIGVFAANTYKASEVLYTSSDGTSMTVNDALNELYDKNNKEYYINCLVTYYNPVSGEKCKAGEAVSTTGIKTGCMKWYIYKDDGTNYTMILDHNTTATIAWNTNNKNVSYEESNVKTEVDKLVSVSNWKDTPRLISTEEITKITGNANFDSSNENSWYFFDSNNQTQTMTSKGTSKYAWLFDYTKGCTSSGCNVEDSSNYGYWTSTTIGAASYGNSVWYVLGQGRLLNNSANNTGGGIRPVITIPKSKLS